MNLFFTKKEWQYLKAVNQFKDKSGFEYVNNFKRIKGTSKRVTESVHRLVATVYCEKSPTVHNWYSSIEYPHQNIPGSFGYEKF